MASLILTEARFAGIGGRELRRAVRRDSPYSSYITRAHLVSNIDPMGGKQRVDPTGNNYLMAN